MSKSSKKSTRKITLSKGNSRIIKYISSLKDRSNLFNEISQKYDVQIKLLDNIFVIKSHKDKAKKIYDNFLALDSNKRELERQDFLDAANFDIQKNSDEPEENKEIFSFNNWTKIELNHYKQGQVTIIKPKTENQKLLIEEILNKKVTLALGSAGSGKSLIALAVSLKLLEMKRIVKIIMSRPVVEAGDSIGYLPGNLEQKMEPFLAPTMALLAELVGKEKRDKLISSGQIEIVNIGYLRGMTLSGRDPVVTIIEEVQNLDFMQHKLLLSRLGSQNEGRMIFCGDQRQSDLRNRKDTLSIMYNIIKDSPYVGAITFTRDDIVRSPVCKDLMERIETWEDGR